MKVKKVKKGIMLLDIVVIILAIGLIAVLVLPMLQESREKKLEQICRQRMMLISQAQLRYFETAGGKIDPNAPSPDTVALKEGKGKNKTTAQQEIILRSFTNEFSILRKYLPSGADTFEAVCPLDGRAFIIVARDSFFYSISCPNGHGQIILGSPSWETK